MIHKNCILGMLALAPLLLLGEDEDIVPAFWSGETALAEDAITVAIDCRGAFPVAKLENETALQNLNYSAVGWDFEPKSGSSRKVTITAQSGSLEDGVFSSDGTAEFEVLASTQGRGVFDWTPSGISKRIYRITHTVRSGSTIDTEETLYGYFDFTHCASGQASQAEVEDAVIAEFTHAIAVVQDKNFPWQPVDTSVMRSGVETDASLGSGEVTDERFIFNGCGTLRYEYALSGGVLEIWSDNMKVQGFDTPTDNWQKCDIQFPEFGVHEVVFRYKSVGDGATALLRNVRWEEMQTANLAEALQADVRIDLREGVRMPKYLADVLPFEYSSTNWIGDVAAASPLSVARVTVVQLTGTDPDVRNWTEVVPNTFMELVNTVGEDAVKWKPRNGVWKATFDIMNSNSSVHQEIALFDLRSAKGRGLVIFLGSVL